MVIKEETPITLAEVSAMVGDSEKGKAVKDFIKKFVKMKVEDAKAMKEEIRGLKLMKLKEADIVKIVDFMPKDISELNKIISESSLDQEEMDKILDVVRKY